MNSYELLIRHLYISVLLLIGTAIFFACQQDIGKYNEKVFAEPDSVQPPVIIKAGEFEVLPLHSLSPPAVHSLLQFPPPTMTDAGFYVTMQNFNTEDGLALSSLICAYKDRAGNIWFGTSGNGLSVYNGNSFTNFSSGHGLIHNFITSITQDSDGNFWFGTYGGISKYDGITVENFTTKNGLPHNTIREILEDRNGTIWIASAGGVSKYQPSEYGDEKQVFTNYDEGNGLIGGSVLSILEDSKGNLWFAGVGGISKYNRESSADNTFTSYTTKMGVKNQVVNTIIEDDDGNIWLGTREFLIRYDPITQTYFRFTTAEGLTNSYIISSAKDSRGYLWFGTKGGVTKYSKTDGSFLNFTTEEGLADNEVLSITEDDAGSLWFGTYGGGISKYDGEALIEFTKDQGLPGKAVYAVAEDRNDNLWFAPLNGGIVKYRRNGKGKMGGTFINYTDVHGLANNTVYTSVEDKSGNLWFGTATGLSMFDGKKFYTYTTDQGLPDNYINALFLDREGNLWIGTYDNGVSKFDGTSFTNFSTAQGLVHKTVWNFFEDKEGNLWIATRGGLSRFDGVYFMNFTTDQGLPDNKLSTVIQDSKGNILTAGWGGGVSIIRKENVAQLSVERSEEIRRNIFEHFSTADGLANDVVYNILEDSDGNIIIGSSNGFTVLRGGISNGNSKIAADSIENYNEKTGYPIKDISHIYSMYEDSRGGIWAGTGDKLIHFDYSKVVRTGKAPPLSLKDIKINHEHISWHTLDWAKTSEKMESFVPTATLPPYAIEERLKFGRLLTISERDSMIQNFKSVSFDGITPFSFIPQNLVLPYNLNNVSFDFIGVETARPHLVRYRFKLEGNDESWSPVTSKTTASFGNIFEGSYTFMVQAKSPQGIWSKPLMYQFTILPPWYRTGVAYFIYILIFCAGVYSVHRIQKARTIRNEREKIQQRELEQAKKIERAYHELKLARQKELQQSKEIERSYHKLEMAHKTLQDTQQKLVQQEKLASLGQLTAGIAHEIKNPLNFVTNFSELSIEIIHEIRDQLEEKKTEPELQKSRSKGNSSDNPKRRNGRRGVRDLLEDIENNLNIINDHGRRADSIIKSILQQSSGNSVLEPTDLNNLIEEFVNFAFHGMRSDKNPIDVHIMMDLDDEVGEILLRGQDFSRVITNLCNNAFDAMKEKYTSGSVDPSEYKPELKVRTRCENSYVIIEMEDNGPGISQKILDKIFQPFFTTKKGTAGTGLGLYITNDIVKAHGGTLEIESELNVFSRFIIKIPKQ